MARYFVQHREVGWLALVAVLVWGGISYTRLAQQEDPDIPDRRALLVTHFPGASAAKVEALVTRKLEAKLNELASLEEMTSQSRGGVSVIHLTQRPAPQAVVEQEWDKFRARLGEVRLPDGCQAPRLNTEFGNTVTLLFALTSPAASDAEVQARADLIRNRLAELRQDTGAAGRAAVFAFFPPDVGASYRDAVQQKFVAALVAKGWTEGGSAPRLERGSSFLLADFATRGSRADLETFLAAFQRDLAGSDGELHPDFGGAVVWLGEEPRRNSSGGCGRPCRPGTASGNWSGRPKRWRTISSRWAVSGGCRRSATWRRLSTCSFRFRMLRGTGWIRTGCWGRSRRATRSSRGARCRRRAKASRCSSAGNSARAIR
ncbi:MAG: efflux RND transporter permease subunit [Verrucomicrobia bacterium]|nr:efflux RND transporter permease subunit [Verrucomicrobiota bacterium]